MKIGILIKEFEALENWEIRIIKSIKDDPNFELKALIKDNRGLHHSNDFQRSGLSKKLFNKQVLLERKKYLKKSKSIDRIEIIEYLETIEIINVKIKSQGYCDSIDFENSLMIQNCNLDVILKHGFNDITGDILNVAKHGVWFLVHSSISLKKGGLPGFWEVLKKEPVVEVLLVQIKYKSEERVIIDKAYYNRNLLSAVVTNNILKESSVSFLIKNLKKIEREDVQNFKETISLNNLYRSPCFYHVWRYLFGFYKSYVMGHLSRMFIPSLVKGQFWTLFIGKGKFMDSNLADIEPLRVPNDEFWADPFLFKHLGQFYVFFEVYSYTSKKGKISCGRVENNQLVDISDVLDFDYHLSYPFVFEEEGEIFMMPETGDNKRLEIYKCIDFPKKWELFSTSFEGESVQDTTLYIDNDGERWLFLNKVIDSNVDRTSELYIYKVDSLRMNSIVPHKMNPVIIDSRVARGGGAIFKFENKIIRPSQRNTDGIYGKALNINQITKLTLEEYSEETIRIVKPNFQEELLSIHHLHQIDEMFIFDGAFRNQKSIERLKFKI